MLLPALSVLPLSLALLVTHDTAPAQLTINDPSSLGVDSVKQYSGYANTTPGAHMFYWAFESRRDPENDPTILWLSGGPGCSSLLSTLFENGPATLNPNLTLNHNPYSWNNEANIIYLDQPVEAGFSDGSKLVNITDQATPDVTIFLDMFFKQFPHWAKNFHIAGESFAGRFVPTFAEAIMNNPNSTYSVKSILVGNAVVDPIAEVSAYHPMLCGEGGYPQRVSNETCKVLADALPGCVAGLKKCIKYGVGPSNPWCPEAHKACVPINHPMGQMNPYDITADCPDSRTELCDPTMDPMIDFYNEERVKKALGADSSIRWRACRNAGGIVTRFNYTFDSYQFTPTNVSALIDQGVRVLVYAGDKDIICNWVGQRMWTSHLDWSGKRQFNEAVAKMGSKEGQWVVDGQPAGEKASFDKLSLYRIYDAGHMAPHDQPKNVYAMLRDWLAV